MRQRRTIRFVQILLIAMATALLLFAGYSWGQKDGFEAGRQTAELGGPQPASTGQVATLTILGIGALAGALSLQGKGGTVRLPTPARLEELAGRTEQVAQERANDEDAQERAADQAP